ncbi:MAG: glycoside hydrolase family 3 C-terminal domain-containing protein, partial [Rhodospirillaceae bacterium]|nr:glycoside hydrolase family 3 C-terminal domain-containing protein [Rhodospirillaceae bacterium]
MNAPFAALAQETPLADDPVEARVVELVGRMTIEEKIGQMVQTHYPGEVSEDMRGAIEAGQVGSLLNVVDADVANELQRIATEESRLGIPLLLARDVIHGFRTVLPIPLGQAATWNPELVERGTRNAALEAARTGINWALAPMIDISRDPRWGRIAESFGEDPYLTSRLAVAMVEGFQGGDLSAPGTIAACAKHFAGYGASEAGRDYNTTNIPENELRNVYLPPFKATVDAGVATLMTSFSDLDGVPTSGNRFLMQEVLRDEWDFDGFVVSDWDSIDQLTDHGFAADFRDAAHKAVTAGVNMEMVSRTYADHLVELVEEGETAMERVDQLVGEILRIKLRLGLFENPYTETGEFPEPGNDDHLAVAREAALQSLVLLQNEDNALPLDVGALDSITVIGPLSDDPYEQLGTWIFDGDPGLSRTPLQAIRAFAGDRVEINFVRALETSRSRDTDGFGEALAAARASDAVVLFLGEESILSGEAHSRADIDLPGAQVELVHALRAAGKPVIAFVLAGRPLTVENILEDVDALVFAWHPGTMGGPAIADVLFGVESPSGKLPVTFPRVVGQIPIYYAHKNTGKPATPDTYVHLDDLPVRGAQAAFGMTSHHLDAGYTPLFPFGFGLSYGQFTYSDIELTRSTLGMSDSLTVQAVVTNSGVMEADEVVQLYVRDLVGDVTRPVKELKGFRRIRLQPG